MDVNVRLRAACCGLWTLTLVATAGAADAPTADPVRAITILKDACSKCHGGKAPRGGFDVSDRKGLVDRKLIIKGNPDASELLLMVESGHMPPGDLPKPDAASLRTLRDWIKAGLPDPPPPPPKYGEEHLLKLIASDWQGLGAARKPKVRYLSLNHLLATESGKKRLPRVRAELTRVLGAFVGTAAPGLELKPLDESQSVFRLDLESIGWEARPFSRVSWVDDAEKFDPLEINLFDLVLLEYPYGVVPVRNKAWPAVRPMVQATKPIRPVPYVRGDWLASALTDPALGGELLSLLGKPAGSPVPAAPAAGLWPGTIDLDEAALELGYEADKEGLGKALAEVGLREAGGVKRSDWERYWAGVIRRLERGHPVLPLDQARRDGYSSDPKFTLTGRTIDFKTKAPKDRFYGGDLLALKVEASADAALELVVFDQFLNFFPVRDPQPLRAGKPLVEDDRTGHKVDTTPAKEWWVLIAVGRDGGDASLAAGVPVVASAHRKQVRSRYVHLTLYDLNPEGTAVKTPIDRAARTFVPFETLGPRPKPKPKPKAGANPKPE